MTKNLEDFFTILGCGYYSNVGRIYRWRQIQGSHQRISQKTQIRKYSYPRFVKWTWKSIWHWSSNCNVSACCVNFFVVLFFFLYTYLCIIFAFRYIMDTWTKQMGFPVVHIKYNKAKSGYELTQQRFLADPDTKPESSSQFKYLKIFIN